MFVRFLIGPNRSRTNIWHLCHRPWSPQCRIIVKAAIVNLLYAIWFARNNARFNSKTSHLYSAIVWIISNTSMAGNKTNSVSSSSIADFLILKSFNVTINPPKPSIIKEIIGSLLLSFG
ncbi:hypothetical protein QL285_095089 [Trifolium repens]|nr:hypothetical protein QL285_095089 [Trifolium repens]